MYIDMENNFLWAHFVTFSLGVSSFKTKICACDTALNHKQKNKPDLHCGEGVQGGKGSRGNAGDPVVVQREQTHRAKARKCRVVDAADLVAAQHSGMRVINSTNKSLYVTHLPILHEKQVANRAM